MSDYDRRAWEDLQEWKERQFSRRARRWVPKPVRERASAASRRTAQAARKVPKAEEFEAAVRQAVEGLFRGGNRLAVASVRTKAVIRAYGHCSPPPRLLSDIRALELRDVDETKPRWIDVLYLVTGVSSGAAAGFVISGGEVAAVMGATGGGAAGATGSGGVGAAPGAGAGAAPGAAVIASAMAGDAAVALGTSMRLVAHIGAYYGADLSRPEERLRSLGVLGFATAGTGGKQTAYQEINRLVQALVRNATWRELNQNHVTKIITRVYKMLTIRLTKKRLGNAVPILGIGIGAGINAYTISQVADAAEHLYREQFLQLKYGIESEESLVGRETIDGAAEEVIDIVSIIEEELAASGQGGDADGEPRPVLTSGPLSSGGFTLQFPANEIEDLAGRYSYNDDKAAREAGRTGRERGHLTASELQTIVNWKTNDRVRGLLDQNRASAVREATMRAIEDGDERAKMQALTELKGVAIPTASAVLHFLSPENYPILDRRALESLGASGQSQYSVTYWLRYLEACRAISRDAGVSLRVLDKALWQYSVELDS